jgi:hypothetical protein
MTGPRPLRRATAFENGILRTIVAADETLRHFDEQIAGATVVQIDSYGSIRIEPIGGRTVVRSQPMRKLPAEGKVKDSDGIEIHFLLFAQQGWLCELQIYKDDGSPIYRRISAEDLEVLVLG